MLDLILKLIDQLKALVKQHESDNRKLHEDFVEPLYKSVFEIHKLQISYMDDWSSRMHEGMSGQDLLDIQAEMLESRHKIWHHTDKAFLQVHPIAKVPQIATFMEAVVQFLDGDLSEDDKKACTDRWKALMDSSELFSSVSNLDNLAVEMTNDALDDKIGITEEDSEGARPIGEYDITPYSAYWGIVLARMLIDKAFLDVVQSYELLRAKLLLPKKLA